MLAFWITLGSSLEAANSEDRKNVMENTFGRLKQLDDPHYFENTTNVKALVKRAGTGGKFYKSEHNKLIRR